MGSSKYINRELSWIEFNKRVLNEAQDTKNPLLERLKFLSIVSTNLDEFMSIRVAGVQSQIKAGYEKSDPSGLTPSNLMKRIVKRTKSLSSEMSKMYRELIRALGKEGIIFCTYDDLNLSQKKKIDEYYHNIVYPILTPMAIDQSHPFPLVHSLHLYLAVVLKREGDCPKENPHIAIVQVPSNLSRVIPLPTRKKSKRRKFMLLDDLIKHHIQTLFRGYSIVAVNAFRVTRNADLSLDEEGAEDLLEEIEKELRQRRWGFPVRLEVDKDINPYALERLKEQFEIEDLVVKVDGPIDFSFLMKLVNELKGFDHLKYPRTEPIMPAELAGTPDYFSILQQKDILLYHPYESFQPVTDFICQAACDPKVLAIKMTLYRVSGNSKLIKALLHAAESGKQVTVAVELKARFDEERNIAWARALEKAGCHVVYGLVGLKTHAKMTLVIRQEGDVLKRYVHIGTGNYNENTARLYTDIGLMTSHPVIGDDVAELFNEITGYSSPRNWQAIAVAPTDLKERLFQLVRREAEFARAGKPARIIAKMNSLSNQEMIDELYQASQAGVKIDLIVRGICCLRPGIPGLSENIRVISIIDRFLEHSRIYYFKNGEKTQYWIASSDWMTRNLARRIELMCPIFDPKLCEVLKRILQMSLRDNVKARLLLPSGSYIRVSNEGEEEFRSQFAALHVESWKAPESKRELVAKT